VTHTLSTNAYRFQLSIPIAKAIPPSTDRFQLRKIFRPPLIDSDCERFSAFQLSISIANDFPLPIFHFQINLKKNRKKKFRPRLPATIKHQISVSSVSTSLIFLRAKDLIKIGCVSFTEQSGITFSRYKKFGTKLSPLFGFAKSSKYKTNFKLSLIPKLLVACVGGWTFISFV
jgi:hypothetical protein